MKTLLEIGMEQLLTDRYDDFTMSLRGSGIDVATKTWSAAAIEHNAQLSVDLMIHVAAKDPENGRDFLSAALAGLDAGDYLRTMALVYATFDLWAMYPAYGIVQHGIDEDLLREYCTALRKWISAYLHAIG